MVGFTTEAWSRRRFMGQTALVAGAGALRPLQAMAQGAVDVPVFASDAPAWKTTWDAALTVLAGNIKSVPGYDKPVLFEGSTYQGIWQECGPHEGLVYATLRKYVAPAATSAIEAARNNHMAFFHLQKPDGQLPASIKINENGYGQIQMVVPIAATAWELVQLAKDDELLATAYKACSRWDGWLREFRDTRKTGLVEGFCTYDTGHDNSPRWKGIPNRCPDADAKKFPPIPSMPRLCPDLSATVYGGRIALAEMAKALGKRDEAARWLADAEKIRQLILTKLYSPEDAAFYDLDAQGKFVKVRSDVISRVLGEHVLKLSDRRDKAIFEAVWSRQLHNPKAFWGPYPLASIAQDDPTFVRPIPRNSWGGASQALTALRAPRWMEHYGKGAELRYMMEKWCEAIMRHTEFRQQMDPQTGDFTPAPIPAATPRPRSPSSTSHDASANPRRSSARTASIYFTVPFQAVRERSMFGHILLSLIVAISILLMLTRPRGIAEVYWVGGGALLLVALRLVPLGLAGRAVAEGSDVYLFLIGMMLLSELARGHGVFDWLAAAAVRGANGSTVRLFTLVYGIGTLVTIFMSNDATAVVLTPAILTAVRKAKVQPLPHLFACALIANAASFVLPISNPANLVVFHQGMPPLGRWLLAFGVPSLVSIASTYLVMRIVFRAEMAATIEEAVETHPLTVDGKLVLAGLGIVVAVMLVASANGRDLGLPACLAALAITAAVSIKTRSNPLKLAREISWGTLALVAGLFVMVDAVESIGALRYTQAALAWAQGLPSVAGAYVASFGVGIANNLVNNLPLGLIAGGTLQAAHTKGLLASAVLIGVDLGPNLSITGSLATILWLIALRKEGLSVSFWDFLKVGAVAMPVAMFVAVGGAVLMRALFGT